jgi:hypothetical protein
MTTDQAQAEAVGGPRPLSEGERTAVSATAAAVAALGLLGFVNSFSRVADAARASFGPLAVTVPIGIDLGIAVFSALDIVLARLDMRVRWLRVIPWTLTGATVYLNVASEREVFGMVAHAVLPLLWVVAVEVGAHVLRKRAKLGNPSRMDRIRVSRWLLAPLATLALWRRMVLWEVRSYPSALGRERDRVLAKTDLQDRYGRLWRMKATRRERALYRLGELAPDGITAVRGPSVAAPALPALPPAPPKPVKATRSASGKTGRGTRSTRPRRTTRTATAPADVDDLMPLGWQIAADHEAKGVRLTRDRLREAIRQTGQSISTDRAGVLLARLRTEAPTDPSETAGAGPTATPTAAPTSDGPHGPTGDHNPPANTSVRPGDARSDRTSSPDPSLTAPERDAALSAKTTAAPRHPITREKAEVQSS